MVNVFFYFLRFFSFGGYPDLLYLLFRRFRDSIWTKETEILCRIRQATTLDDGTFGNALARLDTTLTFVLFFYRFPDADFITYFVPTSKRASVNTRTRDHLSSSS